MRKSLTAICAAFLVSGVAGCGGGAGNEDQARLDKAANQLSSDGVVDTSADDAALNEVDLGEEEAPPANGAAPPDNAVGNRH